MKATVVFQTSDNKKTVEVLVTRWPKIIKKGDYFRMSALDLPGNLAEVSSITWGYDSETYCRVDCIVNERTMFDLETQARLRPAPSYEPGHVLKMSIDGWKGNDTD